MRPFRRRDEWRQNKRAMPARADHQLQGVFKKNVVFFSIFPGGAMQPRSTVPREHRGEFRHFPGPRMHAENPVGKRAAANP